MLCPTKFFFNSTAPGALVGRLPNGPFHSLYRWYFVTHFKNPLARVLLVVWFRSRAWSSVMTQLNSKVSQRVILGISKGKKGIQWNFCADFKAESYSFDCVNNRSRSKILNILPFHSSPIHHTDRAKLGVSRQNWCVEEDLNETSKYLRRLGLGDSDQRNSFHTG